MHICFLYSYVCACEQQCHQNTHALQTSAALYMKPAGLFKVYIHTISNSLGKLKCSEMRGAIIHGSKKVLGLKGECPKCFFGISFKKLWQICTQRIPYVCLFVCFCFVLFCFCLFVWFFVCLCLSENEHFFMWALLHFNNTIFVNCKLV